MFVKVCGLKSEAQIDKAIELGFDAIGVVTYHKSIRYCTSERAIELANYAKNKIKTFAVGLSYSDVKEVEEVFDCIQIYEPKPHAKLVFASNHMPPDNLEYRYFVYDASVGSGEFKSFPSWLKNISGDVIVAGGLDKDNVQRVIQQLNPFGVDVSSGVEINGEKDFELMQAFIKATRNLED